MTFFWWKISSKLRYDVIAYEKESIHSVICSVVCFCLIIVRPLTWKYLTTRNNHIKCASFSLFHVYYMLCDIWWSFVEYFTLLLHSCHDILIDVCSAFTDDDLKCEINGPFKYVKGSLRLSSSIKCCITFVIS